MLVVVSLNRRYLRVFKWMSKKTIISYINSLTYFRPVLNCSSDYQHLRQSKNYLKKNSRGSEA